MEAGKHDRSINHKMEHFNEEMTKIRLEIKELQLLVRRANGRLDRGRHEIDPR